MKICGLERAVIGWGDQNHVDRGGGEMDLKPSMVLVGHALVWKIGPLISTQGGIPDGMSVMSGTGMARMGDQNGQNG